MRAFVAVGVTESIVDGNHRSVLTLRDRDLDRATSMEALVKVHAIVVKDTFEKTALKDITATDLFRHLMNIFLY